MFAALTQMDGPFGTAITTDQGPQSRKPAEVEVFGNLHEEEEILFANSFCSLPVNTREIRCLYATLPTYHKNTGVPARVIPSSASESNRATACTSPVQCAESFTAAIFSRETVCLPHPHRNTTYQLRQHT